QLARSIGSPVPDGAIRAQRVTGAQSGPDLDDPSQAGHPLRHGTVGCRVVAQLAEDVLSPGPDRAVSAQGNDDIAPYRDLGEPGHPLRGEPRRGRAIA